MEVEGNLPEIELICTSYTGTGQLRGSSGNIHNIILLLTMTMVIMMVVVLMMVRKINMMVI